MICPKCKKELIGPGRFCGYCGAPLGETAEEEKTTSANNDFQDAGDGDEMKTVMANGDSGTEELPQTEFDDTSAVEEKTTFSTQSDDSNQTVELEHAKRIQEKKTNKRQSNSKKRQKKNSTERLIPIMAAIAVVAVVVVVLLAARLILTGKNNDWIAQLSELKSTQSTVQNGTVTDYQLDGEFERMSVKATTKPQVTAFSADDQKLLQVWIDDSLVYEIEEVQDEKEEWTFAIDLRGVDTVRIFTSDDTKLEDVQVIRQSAQKETETAQKDSSTNNSKMK